MINAVDPGTGRRARTGRTNPPIPCRVHDLELWFSESPADLTRAKQLCSGCPIRSRCLQEALERGEPWGVWGGEVIVNGLVRPFKRGPGRPRKQAA
ncbi:WhiB family transcriptional regulator [Microlunatus soli]|uniref:Transcriptional regulator WhiB n=1 Tax=Microlunatus soli TaxID=630515 RepID=A0A1H1M7K1_9ACTN|nr:WhiB family transcriptional regulator [Microlunatus soli]SDR82748.1 WhiB family transcriptional regulator, redox-sensing transcriptional regulator [Microlunatus soli]